MSGCWAGAALRSCSGYATHLHLDAGIGANKSAETASETIAEVAWLRLVSEPKPYRNSRAAELFRGRYLYTPSVPRGVPGNHLMFTVYSPRS